MRNSTVLRNNYQKTGGSVYYLSEGRNRLYLDFEMNFFNEMF